MKRTDKLKQRTDARRKTEIHKIKMAKPRIKASLIEVILTAIFVVGLSFYIFMFAVLVIAFSDNLMVTAASYFTLAGIEKLIATVMFVGVDIFSISWLIRQFNMH